MEDYLQEFKNELLYILQDIENSSAWDDEVYEAIDRAREYIESLTEEELRSVYLKILRRARELVSDYLQSVPEEKYKEPTEGQLVKARVIARAYLTEIAVKELINDEMPYTLFYLEADYEALTEALDEIFGY